MKKFFNVIQLVFMLVFFVGCKKESTISFETLPIEPEIFHYVGTEQVQAITVDEDGLLYTATFLNTNPNLPVLEEGKLEDDTQRFCIYDLDGNCIEQVDVTLGNAMIHAMVIEEDTLYCVTSRINLRLILCAINLTTWEVTELAYIEDYYLIENIIPIGDYLYLFGCSELASGKEYSIHPKVANVNYNNEMLGRISKIEENPEIEFLAIDFPLGVFKTKENTLMIHHYNEEHGFGFLEFSPQEETLQVVGWKNNNLQDHCLVSCEDGYLFMKGYWLHYGTVDGMEAQIMADDSLVFTAPSYVKGFVFYYDYEEQMVERVCITDTLRENKEIHLLINGTDTVDMYGCGYRMIREEVDGETFSLKVLARDSDFDLYLLESNDSNAYNLRKNGVFYPLNEVTGVKEYLDACFPYLKEIATNEDGDIWMLPIRLDIPVLLYDKEYCEKQGVDFSEMDYQKFLAFTRNAEIENEGKVTNVKIIPQFFAQYFSIEESVNTELFQTYAKQLKDLYEVVGEYIYPKTYYYEVLPEFFYEYLAFSKDLVTYSNEIEKLEMTKKVDIMEVPKISEGVSNVGKCIFFAVNAESQNLEATLSYISTLCRYLMTIENSFLLVDRTTYTDSPFLQNCYEIYENGAIYFAMEKEVYDNVFMEYLEGKITLEEMIEEVERRREFYIKE